MTLTMEYIDNRIKELDNIIIKLKAKMILIKKINDYNKECTSKEACLGYIRIDCHEPSIKRQFLNLVAFAKLKNLRIHDVLFYEYNSGGPFKTQDLKKKLKKNLDRIKKKDAKDLSCRTRYENRMMNMKQNISYRRKPYRTTRE
tara:strand:- start:456 stop:887 length:432 start_codon:yes stop_codon:yes gene_type:complete